MAREKAHRVKIAKDRSVKRGEESKMKKKPGGSNVGEYKGVKSSEFAGKSGGAPAGSYPINTKKRARAALSYAHNAPDPAGIKRKVYSKYPELKKAHEKDEKKK